MKGTQYKGTMVIMGGDLFFTVLGLSMVDVLVGGGIFWTMF
tara:strand:+ start:1244 stop:1366 length:123 start_codon:yes stop_codon:yes gene_type:complete